MVSGLAARMVWAKAALICACLVVAAPAQATCRLALALGLDVSSSVDAREYRLQLDGLASALQDPDVQAAIFAMPHAHVRLMVYEWSGVSRQRVLVDWTIAQSPADVASVAGQLRATTQRSGREATGLGTAILYGARALQTQADCWQLTLDVSGDGPNNEGPEPEILRDRPEMARVTVNALVVATDAPNAGASDRRQAEIKELLSYFATRVITGPLAFTEAALTFDDFEAAMRRKLLKELAVLATSSREVPARRFATLE